jgi:hypothetical protein
MFFQNPLNSAAESRRLMCTITPVSQVCVSCSLVPSRPSWSHARSNSTRATDPPAQRTAQMDRLLTSMVAAMGSKMRLDFETPWAERWAKTTPQCATGSATLSSSHRSKSTVPGNHYERHYRTTRKCMQQKTNTDPAAAPYWLPATQEAPTFTPRTSSPALSGALISLSSYGLTYGRRATVITYVTCLSLPLAQVYFRCTHILNTAQLCFRPAHNKNCHMRFSFSRRWKYRCASSELWRRVDL